MRSSTSMVCLAEALADRPAIQGRSGSLSRFRAAFATAALLGLPLGLEATDWRIETIAGVPEAHPVGRDHILATEARLRHPKGVAVDRRGFVYIADMASSVVRVLDTEGNLRSFAGSGIRGHAGDGGIANAAQLNYPMDVAVHDDPFTGVTAFIADTNNNIVRRVDANHAITTVAGSGVKGFDPAHEGGRATGASLDAPYGVAVDRAGATLYIADSGNHRIRKVDLLRNIPTISTLAGCGVCERIDDTDAPQATAVRLGNPKGVALGEAANVLYIADFGNNRVRMLDLSTRRITTVEATRPDDSRVGPTRSRPWS